MTTKEKITARLEADIDFRERRFREKILLEMVLEKHGYAEYTIVPVNELLEIVKDYQSYEREWRHILQHNEQLRGSDWLDGKNLAQEKQIDLGYQPRHYEISKIINGN